MDVHVPRPKFEEMAGKVSCCTIAEKGCSNGSINYNNEMYVITASLSDQTGYLSFWGNKAVPLKSYSGALKPLKYHDPERYEEVSNGKRERGYNGMLIQCDGQLVVLTGETIYFHPTETEIQLALF